MLHPLDGIWEKIRRAEELTQSLKNEVDDFIKSGQYSAKHVVGESPSSHRLLAVGPPPPLRFAVLAGEVIHHCRTSLDHLVWQLVLANGGKPSSRHAFPHCSTPEKFQEACRHKVIHGVSFEAARLIESSQPYHCKSGYQWSRTWVLHELDIMDKHRLLVVVSAYANTFEIVVDSHACEKEPTILRIHKPEHQVKASLEGEEVFRLELQHPDPNFRLKAEPIVNIAFENFGPAQGQPVISCLNQLREGAIGTIKQFRHCLRQSDRLKS